MKANPSFPQHPVRFLQPKLPSQEELANVLGIVLALLLVVATVWAVFPSRSNPVPAEAGLELILSGAVTNTLSLGADELKTAQCSLTGFQLASTQGAAFPLTLAFRAPASANGAFYLLGSSDTFTLNLNGTAYTLLSGTVTTTPGVYTFNASLVDTQSQPLQLSGRLSCP